MQHTSNGRRRRTATHRARNACGVLLFAVAGVSVTAQPATTPRDPSPARLVEIVREAAARLHDTPGMQRSYNAFLEANRLPDSEPLRSRFCTVRILFEATRDAGLWNLHWAITNREPNSENVWRQWAGLRRVAFVMPTATAECDELSALFAFLARQAGVPGVGMLWPTSNHTVAVWSIATPAGRGTRVVVPTTQIFLDESDMLGTRTFDPWKQRAIYEYIRQDAPASLRLPARLMTFLREQIDRYAGAGDSILQRLRYLRAAVFNGTATPGEAAMSAAVLLPTCTNPEDRSALDHFVHDIMLTEEEGAGGG